MLFSAAVPAVFFSAEEESCPRFVFQATPLGIAVRKGEVAKAKQLIENNADVNASIFKQCGSEICKQGGPTLLKIAQKNQDLAMIKLLKEKGAKDESEE